MTVLQTDYMDKGTFIGVVVEAICVCDRPEGASDEPKWLQPQVWAWTTFCLSIIENDP